MKRADHSIMVFSPVGLEHLHSGVLHSPDFLGSASW